MESPMQLHGLFPTPLGMFDRGCGLHDEERAALDRLERRKNHGNYTSVNPRILEDPAFVKLNEFFNTCIKEFVEKVYCPANPEIEVRITQSWANWTGKGEYHHQHAHPNSFIAGVFFVQTTPQDRTTFYRGTFTQLQIDPYANFNVYNSPSWWFSTPIGQLWLFPSYLQHLVPVVEGDRTCERISLAFNTWPVGTVGCDKELTTLHLPK